MQGSTRGELAGQTAENQTLPQSTGHNRPRLLDGCQSDVGQSRMLVAMETFAGRLHVVFNVFEKEPSSVTRLWPGSACSN